MMNKKEELSVRWRYRAGSDALIWQLMFTCTGNLIGQKRFMGSRQAFFFCIDILSGKVIRDDYFFADPLHPLSAAQGWFTGLETTLGDLVYCNTCQPHSPEHQGIWAVDFKRGKVVWSRPEIVFAANLDAEFLVYKPLAFAGFPERHFMLIDPFTGADIRLFELDSPEVNRIRGSAVQEEVRQQVILPEFVTGGMDLERMGLQNPGVDGTARYECIVNGSFTVAAVHEPGTLSGTWNSFLQVWQNDRQVYADTLEEHVEKPGMNNFLIRSDTLYYLKAREELVCVALS
jgi:hypothetical protein